MDISSLSAATSGADLVNTKMMASVKVLDMAQDIFSEVAQELIDALTASITGIGQNIDIYA